MNISAKILKSLVADAATLPPAKKMGGRLVKKRFCDLSEAVVKELGINTDKVVNRKAYVSYTEKVLVPVNHLVELRKVYLQYGADGVIKYCTEVRTNHLKQITELREKSKVPVPDPPINYDTI